MNIRSFFIKKISDQNSTVDVVSEPLTSKNSIVSEQVNSKLSCSMSINTLPTLAAACEINHT